MMEMLRTEKLSFAYEKDKPVLTDVSFSLDSGEYACLVGANGSGKSTIAKLLLGLLAGQGGSIWIESIELTAANLTTIRDKVGIVFQNPDNQFIGSTVADDIAFGLENHRVASTAMPAIIEHFAEEVKMAKFLNFEPARLSGGQKQRVAIAGILAMNPQLIIFDEATSMLDPQGKAEIVNIIKALHQKHQVAILSITHDMEEICACDKVLILAGGRITFSGSPQKLLYEEDLLKAANMRLPFAANFAKKFNQYGGKISRPLLMEELVEEIWQSVSKK